jgi:UDP-N-acetylmuramyl pentapeptide phosphotransferase/UDP-N-acetylglucosamine-1-phosphate transferase
VTIFLFTLALSTLLCIALTPLARRFGWLDTPDQRKQHSADIPLMGGPAIFLAMSLSSRI